MSALRLRDSIMTVSTVWQRAFLDAVIAPRRFRRMLPVMRKLCDMQHHPGIMSLEVSDLPAHKTPIQVLSIASGYGGMSAQDLYALLRVVLWIKPQAIFEIGTFQGLTTANLALNSAAQIYTLDLPQDMATDLEGYTPSDSALLQARGQIGTFYREFNQNGRIRQLFGDSRTFDYAPYYGSIDLVLVDACHLYDYVVSDSHHASRLLQPRGAIVWHDFGNSRDVVRAVQQVAREWPVYHVEGSNIAFHTRGVAQAAQRTQDDNDGTGAR